MSATTSERSKRQIQLLSDVLGSANEMFPLEATVRETLGIARSSWPIEIPLSLLRNTLRDGQTLGVRAGEHHCPSQVEIFTRWDDGSAQHVMLHASVDLTAMQELKIEIAGAKSVEHSLACDETKGDVRIDTGAATFVVGGRDGKQIVSASVGGKEFVAAGGQIACWAGYIAEATAAGWARDPTSYVEDFGAKIIERGPVRCVVERVVRFSSADQDELYTRLYFYRNQPWVRLYSWVERGNAIRHPMVSREIAFAADLRYDGPAIDVGESRFGAMSEEEMYAIATPAGRATIVLPWLRELGMNASTNFVAKGADGSVRIEWRPIDSPDLSKSPMNGPCWVPRYWREAAIVIGEDSLRVAPAVRRTLELRNLEVRVDPAYQPHAALFDRLTLLDPYRDELLRMAEAGDSYYLTENYPEDGIEGREWHNWESAYFHGFAWRQIHLDEKVAAYPRTMKPDLGELMLVAYAHTGEARFLRRAKLQARAWPVNVAFAGTDGLQFTFDDMGLVNLKPRGQYHAAAANLVPGTANAGYPGKLLLAMFRMWVLTGEARLKFAFDLLYKRMMAMELNRWPYGTTFDGNRNWALIRDLVRLYQFTEDPKFLADVERVMALLPEKIAPEQWYANYHVRFWNNEGLALVWRLTGSEKAKRLHESLVKDYFDEARRTSVNKRLIFPMVRGWPLEFENIGLCYQIGVAAAQWALWDQTGEAKSLAKHLLEVGTKDALTPSKFWPGQHQRYYPTNVFTTEAWRKRVRDAEKAGLPPPRTDEAGAGQSPGEYARAVALFAKAQIPYDVSGKSVTFHVRLPGPGEIQEPWTIRWPAGKLSGHASERTLRLRCRTSQGVMNVIVEAPAGVRKASFQSTGPEEHEWLLDT